MPTPEYIAAIRRVYGPGRLLLPGVSTVVVRTDLEPGRVHLLLTRRSDTGQWSLPAGIVEPFEQPAAAALRELLEETRVTAHVERLALQGNHQLGLRRIAGPGLTAVDRHLAPAAELHEVGATIAVEVAGERRQLPERQTVEPQPELAREIWR